MRATRGASAIVRGIRGTVDLDYELQMARTNRHWTPAIDTVFLAPSHAVRPHQFDTRPRYRDASAARCRDWFPRLSKPPIAERRTHTKDSARMTTDTMRLADRMQHIGMSPTMKGTMEAERLRRQGMDVVDLGAGEPDFPTPAARDGRRARRARSAASRSTRRTWASPNCARRWAAGIAGLRRRLRARRGRSSRPAASRRCFTRRSRCSAPATKSSRTRLAGRRSSSRSSWPARRP